MKKSIVIVVVLCLSICSFVNAQKSNTLILLNAQNIDQTQQAIDFIEANGGNVRHVFPPDVLIAYLPPEVDQKVTGRLFISQVVREEFNTEDYLPEIKTNKLAISAWNYLLTDNESVQADLSEVTLLGKDTHPPLHELKGEEALSREVLAVVEADKYTSCYMIGRVAVGVILMESAGDAENWTVQQEQITISEIVEGLDRLSYFASQAEVNLTWFYEVHYQVWTSYEPIQERSVPYWVSIPPHHEFLWMNDALSYLGCSDGFEGMYEYANRIRSQYQTDWGYMVFVVMDENDPYHDFADGRCAYARMEGPYVVMTYNNCGDGWGYMSNVFEHETVILLALPMNTLKDAIS